MTVRCEECPLRRLSQFRELPAEQIAFIQDMKQGERSFAPGEALIKQGARKAELLTLLEGWAFRFKTLDDGRRQILNFLMPGDLIGLQKQMDGESPHSVEALTPAIACVLHGGLLWSLYHSYPSLAYDITWLACAEESIVDDALLFVGQHSARHRIAALLYGLHKRARPIWPQLDPLVLPLSQQHLADALGLSLVHVQRTLRYFKSRQLIDLARRGITLTDEAELGRLSNSTTAFKGDRPLL